MITTNERETFRVQGLIQLKNFLPAEKVTRAHDLVLQHLETAGIRRNGAWFLDELPPSTAPNAGSNLVKGLKQQKALAALAEDEVYQVVTELLDGCSAFPMTANPQVLFTLPNATQWTVPHNVWHLDIPRLAHAGTPGVQLFTFLETVVPGGGGTLAVAGSHQLVNENKRIRSKQVKQRLRQVPYFRDLMSRNVTDRLRFVRTPERVGGTELQVVEIHGEPGDIFLMDLRLLHTLAPNATQTPRIMLTQRFLLESLRAAIYGEGHSDST